MKKLFGLLRRKQGWAANLGGKQCELCFLLLVRVRADAERSADMVQDDCRLRERPRHRPIARSSGVTLRHFGHVTFAPSSHKSPVCDTGCSGAADASSGPVRPLSRSARISLSSRSANPVSDKSNPLSFNSPSSSRRSPGSRRCRAAGRRAPWRGPQSAHRPHPPAPASSSPTSLMLEAIAATCASVCVRAFFAYGISRSIAHRSTLSAGHGL